MSEAGRTAKIRDIASNGVHRENLYASQDLADAATDQIYAELFGKNAVSSDKLRQQSKT